jgi:hypothetical protein
VASRAMFGRRSGLNLELTLCELLGRAQGSGCIVPAKSTRTIARRYWRVVNSLSWEEATSRKALARRGSIGAVEGMHET